MTDEDIGWRKVSDAIDVLEEPGLFDGLALEQLGQARERLDKIVSQVYDLHVRHSIQEAEAESPPP